ncbi:hypothetical protein [Saccharococcus sp. Marseille-Q5394]|uniref:hypothetical protein n=1 Tax=Saccharococcus sp. Marseille-Q5394 TaxID=2972778 RepID=UPI0021C626F0|nr:hypothetical protein [Saccharococcus sp. Marseille-Q5394]
MEFKPNTHLQKAIDNHNLRHIRSAVSSYMVSDPADGRREIQPAVRYVEQSGITDLWQDHDGRPFKEMAEWDEDYYGLLQAQLMMNFSKDRFNHTLEVGKKVHGKARVEIQRPMAETAATFARPATNTKPANDLGKYAPILIGGIGLLAVATLIVYLINEK